MRHLLTIAAALAAMAPGLTGALAQEADIAHGKALVETNCAQCHGVGETDASPHPAAPPFRELSERYPIDALEEAFAEGIVTGHEDMPEFEATPQQIADIIAYLASIQPE
ncbi:MAG: cytochrome C [Phyllobacteriaceae bacterium]|nr:cytochrome C [Phyllobacteriaceae bacterium]MBA92069.1 cytochrome C [Phyllobacteriaceae bacterium]